MKKEKNEFEFLKTYAQIHKPGKFVIISTILLVLVIITMLVFSVNFFLLESREAENFTKQQIIHNHINILIAVVVILVWAAVTFDIYWKGKFKRELFYLAYTDQVTGGVNLKYLENHVKNVLNHNQNDKFVLVYINMVKFKLVSDNLGNDVGKLVLKRIYQFLAKSLKEEEYVARVSSDEFVQFMKSSSNTDTIDRLRVVMNRINNYGKQELDGTNLIFKVGIYRIEDNSMEFQQMFDRADMAQQTLAQQGGYETKYAFYDESTRSSLKRDYEIQKKMQSSLDHKEFEVYLQPKYNIQTNKLLGAEALIRWNDSERGLIGPDSFISLFEYNGFITKIDKYVFRQVCRHIRAWLDAGYDPGVISVNLSKAHFSNPNFLDEFENIRKEYSVPPQYIDLEITESLVCQNMALLFDLTEELHNLGYKCSLDDFGSGYSSLNILKNIPVDVLKLDRGFFIGNYDDRSMQVINGIISITKNLGISTVAEGVETTSQIDFLKEIGCDAVQTFIYARPMPINEYRLFAEKANNQEKAEFCEAQRG